MREIKNRQVLCHNIQRIARQIPFVDKVALFIECLRNQFLTMVTEKFFNVEKIKNVGCSLADILQEEDNSGIGRILQNHCSYLLVSKATVDFAHRMDYAAKFSHNLIGREALGININWGHDILTEEFFFLLTKEHLQKWLPDYILEEENISEEEVDPQLDFGWFWRNKDEQVD